MSDEKKLKLKGPHGPMVASASYDIRAILDYYKIPYTIYEEPTESPFKVEVEEIKPMEIPKGLDEFLDFSYGSSKALKINTVTGEVAVEKTSTLACHHCRHFACICSIREEHQEGCKFRTAATCTCPIECEHGRDVCPVCDPCTCVLDKT